MITVFVFIEYISTKSKRLLDNYISDNLYKNISITFTKILENIKNVK